MTTNHLTKKLAAFFDALASRLEPHCSDYAHAMPMNTSEAFRPWMAAMNRDSAILARHAAAP